MSLKSHVGNNKSPLFLITIVALISIATSVCLIISPEKTSFITISISIIFFVIIRYNLYDLLFYAFFLIFLFAQFQIDIISLARWIVLIFLISLSVYLTRNQKPAKNPIALGIGLVAFYSIGTSFVSYYPTISIMKGISLLLLAIFLLYEPLAIQSLHPRMGAKKYMIRMYLFFAILIVISNAIYYFIMPSSSNEYFSGTSFLNERFRGWFVNPNTIGGIYGIFFLPILGYMIQKHRIGLIQLGLIFTFLLALIELLASQSRAGLFSAIVSLSVLALGYKKWLLYMVIMGLIFILSLLNLFSNFEFNLKRDILYRNEIELDGSGRIPIWIETWNRFLEHPVLGSGLGVSDTNSKITTLPFSSSKYTIEKANSFLGALEELGVFGVTIFVFSLLGPILKALWRGVNALKQKNDNLDLLLIAIVVAGLVNSIFEAWLLSVGSVISLSFWIFASLLFSDEGEGEKR